ncbi:golgin subfamily A member 2 isoform X2 [Ambystoma mexicanum]|uniref:golgin subfamily A member 2 isoform X2 n=1 Tax=Ambystoma mexicanum TaxID=8296 RepID=UPI0037E963A4
MADGSRQSKLAAAKKKLKEFQQKSTPAAPAGVKKKRKTKDGSPRPETPTSDSRNSPDPIHAFLKGLVSDLHRSNGLVVPSLGSGKAFMEGDLPAPSEEELTNEASTPFHSSSLTNNVPLTSAPDCILPTQRSSLDEVRTAVQDNRSLTATESLRQLSEQLNGLVSQTSSYVNGENTTASNNTKELDLSYQELAIALDSSNLTNRQLTSRIDELKQQYLDVTGQLEKEKKGFEQRFAKEQGALREQLQVHIQTIGILVSEKSELQTALSHTQQAARQKAGEAEDLANRLQSTRQRMTELERTLASVSQQQKLVEKSNKELEKERDSLRLDLYKETKSGEELKQQNSELSEKLNALASENGAQKLGIEDLHKKLEMAELTMQQFASHPGEQDASKQLQLALEEQARLASQVSQLSESLHHLRAERDQYVEKLKEEGGIWQERTRQLAEQVQILSNEKERSQGQILQLQSSIVELQHASAQPKEPEPQTPAGPTEAELSLQAEVQTLQQRADDLQARFEAQVQDNKQLSRLNQEQEERLLQLEKEVARYSEDSMDRQQILEDMQSDKTTISRALSQNRKLKEQLAELQNGFVKLTNENMELLNGLQSEQHVKKELAKRLGQLQESTGELKEQVETKSQEVQSLQGQRDEYYRHLQQYTAAYQTLATEKEELQRQYLLQVQLMDRLQHDEVQGKVSAEIHLKELRQTQESLGVMAKENEDLRYRISRLSAELDTGLLSRVQGDGVESEEVSEEIQRASLQIPADFESKEEMVNFLTLAMKKVEEEREEMRRHLVEQRQKCRGLQQQVTALRQEPRQHPSHHETGLDVATVPVEVHEALRSAMDKLQLRFRDLMQEKADLKDRVEELEHRCIQLSGETDTIGEYIALYQSQRAILKQRHREKEEYISRLSQDKEEMKLKLMELQSLVMRLVGERDEWYRRFMEVNSTAGRLMNDEGTLPIERRVELHPTDGEGLQEISLSEQMEQDEAVPKASHVVSNSQPPHPSTDDPTAKQIMQLLHEIQNPQQRHASLLENPCIPFFYRADDNDEVRIMII